MDNEIIGKIIREYQSKYLKLLEKVKSFESRAMLLEKYISTTEIVPNDFFDATSSQYCDFDKKLPLKDFDIEAVLFTDLKNSTKTLKYFEDKNMECLYVAYIYYSSKLIADVLDLLGGNLVEITGDGTYSIIMKNSFSEDKFDWHYKDFHHNCLMKDKFCTDAEYGKYMSAFDNPEVRNIKNAASLEGEMRLLFFNIFAAFNIAINKKLRHDIFLTRVGCKSGKCKITKFNIDGHVSQQKLIGSVVHDAAHQASGK